MGLKPLDKQKQKHKKGLWSPDEDMKLRNYITKHGHGCWSSVPANAGLQRNGKSCRLRWMNYLRPGLKRGAFTIQEEETVLTLHQLLGNKWCKIANHLPGRTDNEIKNYWHSYLKKRLSTKAESTRAEAKDKSLMNNEQETDDQISPEPSLPSSLESARRDSSFESFENMQASLVLDTNQSMQQVPQTSNLPKVLFAEWLSLDQFHSSQIPGRNDNSNSNEEHPDQQVHGPVLNEEAFGDPWSSNVIYSLDDMLQSSFMFDDNQLAQGNGLLDFPSAFTPVDCGEDTYI